MTKAEADKGTNAASGTGNSATSGGGDGRQTTTGRIVGNVALPPSKRLAICDVFDEQGKPRTNVLRDHLKQEGRLSEECALKVIKDGKSFKVNTHRHGQEPIVAPH